MLKRLRLKFICINMLIVTIMLLLLFGVLYHSTSVNLEEDSLRILQSLAENPFRQNLPGAPQDDIRLPYFTLQINRYKEVLAIDGGYFDLSDDDFLKDVIRATYAQEQSSGILEDYDLRYYRTETMGLDILAYVDYSAERATLTNLLQTCLLLGTLSLAAFFLISLLLARWAVKPVDRAWTQQRQFVADASHELKTPLTVIMTNAELLQSSDYDDTEKTRFAGNILTMTRQMRGLVEGLLDLARADNGTTKLDFTQLDFSRLASDAVLPFEPLYFERNLQLHCQIQPDICLWGSGSHLRQVLDILLDNAMKYSYENSTVYVSLASQNDGCLLSVANYGPPISKEDQSNIFKRFYRVDQARTMSGSYGLGLPIAESIIHQHKGQIWVEHDGTYNIFFIQLPESR